MSSFFRFVVVMFFFAGTLILSVYLRSANHTAFYQLRRQRLQQDQLQRELAQKQLQLESMTNPASVSHRLGY